MTSPAPTPTASTTPAATVNGDARPLSGVDPATTALDWLRGHGLTGAKEGCAEGECGACSVMVLRPENPGDRSAGGTRWTAINACLIPAAALDGGEVVTSEGLGSPTDLHPVQHEMAVRGGSPVRLLHTRVRLQHGGGVLPALTVTTARARSGAAQSADGSHPDAEHGANGFDLHALSRQPLPLHRLPPDPRRRLCPRRSPPTATRSPTAARRPPRYCAPPALDGASGVFVRPADLDRGARAARRAPRRRPRRRLHGLGRRGQHPRPPRAVRRRHRPAARAAHPRASATRTSRSVPRSPSARSSDGWRAGSRCWTGCSRSSPHD